MTPNGSLLAYSTPADIRSLRDQAAMVSMTFREQPTFTYPFVTTNSDSQPPSPTRQDSEVKSTMIIQTESCNVIVQYLQPRMLLVLEGGLPPHHKGISGVFVDSTDSPSPETDTPADSKAVSKQQKTGRMTLAAHRSKIDLVAKAIRDELDKQGFKMPNDSADHNL